MVSCTLRLGRSRIQTLSLIDYGASGYAFIDKKFAQTNQIPLHPLKYARRLEGFDGQPALTGNITHAAEVIMDLNGHTKKMFLFASSCDLVLLLFLRLAETQRSAPRWRRHSRRRLYLAPPFGPWCRSRWILPSPRWKRLARRCCLGG